jgi:cytochrome c5
MGRDGKQYVVIASGGPGDTDRGGTEQYPQKLVAFALSDRAAPAPTTPAAAASPASAQAATGGGLSPQAIQQGRALTERVCTSCHGLGPELTAGRTAAVWKSVVDEMIAMGAQATPDETRAIVEYLSHAYPVKKER